VIEDVKLYSYWRSSSSWRVRIALGWKQLPHTIVPVNLIAGEGEQWSPAHLERSPAGKIPVLEFTFAGARRRQVESMAILELLEELVPAPRLLPADPFARAQVRTLAELVNSGIQPMQNLSVMKKLNQISPNAFVEWAAHWNRVGLGALEKAVGPSAGKFCVGDEVTFADVLLVPQLASARRFGVEPSAFPRLAEIEARCAALPAFQAAHQDVQIDKPEQSK
jgi:maleylpyruvate isomerase